MLSQEELARLYADDDEESTDTHSIVDIEEADSGEGTSGRESGSANETPLFRVDDEEEIDHSVGADHRVEVSDEEAFPPLLSSLSLDAEENTKPNKMESTDSSKPQRIVFSYAHVAAKNVNRNVSIRPGSFQRIQMIPSNRSNECDEEGLEQDEDQAESSCKVEEDFHDAVVCMNNSRPELNRSQNVPSHIVVLDTGAILRGFRFQGDCLYVTISDVLNEVRDRASRHILDSFPFEIETREPDEISLRAIIDFARKTGDLGNLSTTDLRVMALTYFFEKIYNGIDHLKQEPLAKRSNKTAQTSCKQRNHVEGSLGKMKEHNAPLDPSTQSSVESVNSLSTNFQSVPLSESPSFALEAVSAPQKYAGYIQREFESFEEMEKVLNDDEYSASTILDHFSSSSSSSVITQKSADQSIPVSNQSTSKPRRHRNKGNKEDDTGGWITPNNISQYVSGDHAGDIENFFSSDALTLQNPRVACVTTDFSMQNVMIQMGLSVLTLSGFRIRKTKHWIKRCHTCGTIVPDVERQFCPSCGYATLLRISSIVGEDGSIALINKKHRINVRGTKYAVHMPRGGRHGKHLILTEDDYERESQKHETEVETVQYTPGIRCSNGGSTKNPSDIDISRIVSLADSDKSVDSLFPRNSSGRKSTVVIGHGKRNPNAAARKKKK